MGTISSTLLINFASSLSNAGSFKICKKQEKFLQIDFEDIKNEKQVLCETQVL